MKKLLLLSVIFAAIGCSHGAKQYSGITTWDEPSSVKYLAPSDRAPAGEPTLRWNPVTKPIGVAANGGSIAFDARIEQIMTWTEMVPVRKTRMVPRDQWTWENCVDYQCTGDGGGQSPAWDAFYSAPKAEKGRRLADAIAGLNKDAEELVAKGYFHRKPRSWNAFRDEIRRAERNGVISKQVASEILVNHRQANFVNLGYAPDSCGTVVYRCEVYKSVLVTEEYIVNEPQEFSKVNDVINRRIEVNIVGPKLQSFERETVRVTVGKEQNEVNVDSDYTVYSKQMSHEGATTRVELTGRERMKVDLPQAAQAKDLNLAKAANGKVQLSFNVDTKYLGDKADPNDQLVVRYQLHYCKQNLFGVCGLIKMDLEGPIQMAAITNGHPTIDIDLPKGHTGLVKLQIGRRNSAWYNDRFLPEVKTEKVKIPKR